MAAEQVALVGAFVLLVALVARRIERSPLTVAMAFVAFGLAFGPDGLGLLVLAPDDETVVVLAEATLAMLLFVDASRIELRSLREGIALPARLLGIGLPLTVVAATATAWWLLPGEGFAGALLLGAVLAPTDAALGQAVVSDERVPVAVRQGLNVESGLNDGLVLPVFAVAVALLEGEAPPGAVEIAARVLGGVAVGVAVGLVVPRLLEGVRDRVGLDPAYEQLAVLGMVAVAWGTAEAVGANGFLASFVAGVALRATTGEDTDRVTAYTEDTSQLFSLLAFVLFGALLLPDALAATSVSVVAVAVLALTVVRMVPVLLALGGTGLRVPTKLFVAWFGPRGLATILLGLLVVVEAGEDAALEQVTAVVGWTVLLSVVLHGATATPLAARYGAWFDAGREGPGGDEMREAAEVRRPLLRWQRGT